MIKQSPLRKQTGFTIIEVLVVIVIAGAVLTFGYQMLQTLWSGSMTPAAPLQFEGVFKTAREFSMSHGDTITLEINLDAKTAGLRKYDHLLEIEADTTLNFLYAGRENRTSRFRVKPEKTEEEKPQPDWIQKHKALPGEIEGIYSVSGMRLKGPVILIHFYPNGTSDSVIIHFSESEKFLYLPRQNIPAKFLYNLDITSFTQETETDGKDLKDNGQKNQSAEPIQ